MCSQHISEKCSQIIRRKWLILPRLRSPPARRRKGDRRFPTVRSLPSDFLICPSIILQVNGLFRRFSEAIHPCVRTSRISSVCFPCCSPALHSNSDRPDIPESVSSLSHYSLPYRAQYATAVSSLCNRCAHNLALVLLLDHTLASTMALFYPYYQIMNNFGMIMLLMAAPFQKNLQMAFYTLVVYLVHCYHGERHYMVQSCEQHCANLVRYLWVPWSGLQR